MNKKEKERYLNDSLAFKAKTLFGTPDQPELDIKDAPFLAKLPPRLFKYKKFDEHTIDMLEQTYLYLASADNLDDPFECLVNLDLSRYFDAWEDHVSESCYQAIVEYVLTFVSENEKKPLRDLIYACSSKGVGLDKKKAFSMLKDSSDLSEDNMVSLILSSLADMPYQIKKPEMKERISALIRFSMDARKEIGICSLSENPASQVMWAMYGDAYQGYCVEYDFSSSSFAALHTYPVIYEEERSNNAIIAILSLFITKTMNKLSQNEIPMENTQFYRLFLTKSAEWSFQEEWRVIEQAGSRIKAPKIKAIYVGHKASENHINLIKRLGMKMGFDVYKTEINDLTLKIEFIKILDSNKA